MLSRGRRGFHSAGTQERAHRTHLLFSSQSEHKTAKRKRRTHNKFHQTTHGKKDEMVQASPDELDPAQWTGNQRVLHFGPMAQRDPFFYYYPKGWDILYPATFGFFPYRTSKFRGSSSVVCVWAFGIFFVLGGALMVYLGYFFVYRTPFWTWSEKELQTRIPPIQIAGPILLVIGLILVLIGIISSISTSQFLSQKLRHYHHKGQPASVTVYTTHFKQPRAIYETNPYQPLPPPANPVLENRYAHSTLLSPNAELKLYPPVVAGYSTLSLHGHSPSFVASPYNTLRAVSVNRFPANADITYTGYENQRAGSVSVGRHPSMSSMQQQQRARSVGAPIQRNPSNRSR
ncbi:CRE-ISLO-1 protein [Ditylenchus destructor]|uniref:CRE-ISLO-1 protein n=1 Tax=Ditylenchus destructor TaxID=166010 RepID=A0AAD4N7U6_9BILA|nr:CRE-ISLO-1 protein [Ditylenchus destructor]